MDVQEFREIGANLFGKGWQTKLSRILNMRTARTIRRWASGEKPIPEAVALLLRLKLDSREK